MKYDVRGRNFGMDFYGKARMMHEGGHCGFEEGPIIRPFDLFLHPVFFVASSDEIGRAHV